MSEKQITTAVRSVRARRARITTGFAAVSKVTRQLDARTLLLAGRVLWTAIAALSLLLFLAGAVTELGQLRALCPTDACDAAAQSVQGQLELRRLSTTSAELAASVRALRGLGLTFAAYATYTIALQAVLALGFCAVAGLIFWRKSHDRVAWFASFALLTFGLATYSDVMTATVTDHPGLWLAVEFLRALGSASIVVFLLLFPDGRFLPPWTRWIALGWVALQIPEYFFPQSPLAWTQWPLLLTMAIWGPTFGIIVFAQVYSYRHLASPEHQRQTKWVVHGVSVALIGYFALDAGLWLLVPHPPVPTSSEYVAALVVLTLDALVLLLIPISIAIAILRHHLYDIDVIISRTLVYGALTAMLALIYQATLVTLQTLFITFTGQGSFLANVASTVVIGALFEPLRRRLRTFVNRRISVKVGIATT